MKVPEFRNLNEALMYASEAEAKLRHYQKSISEGVHPKHGGEIRPRESKGLASMITVTKKGLEKANEMIRSQTVMKPLAESPQKRRPAKDVRLAEIRGANIDEIKGKFSQYAENVKPDTMSIHDVLRKKRESAFARVGKSKRSRVQVRNDLDAGMTFPHFPAPDVNVATPVVGRIEGAVPHPQLGDLLQSKKAGGGIVSSVVAAPEVWEAIASAQKLFDEYRTHHTRALEADKRRNDIAHDKEKIKNMLGVNEYTPAEQVKLQDMPSDEFRKFEEKRLVAAVKQIPTEGVRKTLEKRLAAFAKEQPKLVAENMKHQKAAKKAQSSLAKIQRKLSRKEVQINILKPDSLSLGGKITPVMVEEPRVVKAPTFMSMAEIEKHKNRNDLFLQQVPGMAIAAEEAERQRVARKKDAAPVMTAQEFAEIEKQEARSNEYARKRGMMTHDPTAMEAMMAQIKQGFVIGAGAVRPHFKRMKVVPQPGVRGVMPRTEGKPSRGAKVVRVKASKGHKGYVRAKGKR